MEVIHMYCENHMKSTNALCGKTQSFVLLLQVVHIVTTGFLSVSFFIVCSSVFIY
jgi:hypothetical protein